MPAIAWRRAATGGTSIARTVASTVSASPVARPHRSPGEMLLQRAADCRPHVGALKATLTIGARSPTRKSARTGQLGGNGNLQAGHGVDLGAVRQCEDVVFRVEIGA